MLPLECALLATLATGLGALIALYLKRFSISLLWPWALSGGSLLALATLDLIPESLRFSEGSYPAIAVMALLTLSGAAYWIVIQRERRSQDSTRADVRFRWRGVISIFHSFIDGIAIGIGFSASDTLGYILAMVIIAHDLSDGFNTMVLVNYGANRTTPRSYGWLWANALAPLMGTLLTLAISFSRPVIGGILAALAGLFLTISLGEILPTLLSRPHSSRLLATFACGGLCMGCILWWAGSW